MNRPNFHLGWPALLMGLVACGDPAAGGGETPVEDVGEVDAADAAVDVPTLEDATDADGGAGADSGDASDATDARDGSADAGGQTGDPCIDDVDCAVGECAFLVAESSTGICAEPCAEDDDCPRETNCVLLVNSGTDAQQLCLPSALCIDADLDGFGIGPGCQGRDCDDDNGARFPGQAELCDGIDNDCDELIDDAPTDADRSCTTGLPGVCADGRTVCADGLLACEPDALATDEVCNNEDDDCDGEVDEQAPGVGLTRTCYDGPAGTLGVGACTAGVQTCERGGFSGCSGQTLPSVETCDSADNDCDGTPDEGLDVSDWYVDADNDRFGARGSAPVAACRRPTGYVDNASDCDDTTATVLPGAAELPGDGVDQNCDGSEFCFVDADDDGWLPAGGAIVISLNASCDDPGEGTSANGTGDCDDTFDGAYPGNPEVCDGEDNNCSGRIDEANACYANGEACVDPADCRSGLCNSGLCVAPLTCVDLGTCPPLISGAAGSGDVASPSYRARIAVGMPVAAQPVHSARYTFFPGPGPGLSRRGSP